LLTGIRKHKLRSLGDGATAIVATARSGGIGHAFNLFNDNGLIRVFDGQRGSELTNIAKSYQIDLKADLYKFFNTTNK